MPESKLMSHPGRPKVANTAKSFPSSGAMTGVQAAHKTQRALPGGVTIASNKRHPGSRARLRRPCTDQALKG